jgi:hypothetical protein
MDEKSVLRINSDLAKKYLESNLYQDWKWRKALQVLGELEKKYTANNGNSGPWKVWVYAEFKCPNLILGFISGLHKRCPKLAESLVFSANTEFLLGIYLFVVNDEDGRLTITDFLRIN